MDFRADHLPFERVMSDFRKKNPAERFRGEKSCKEIPGEKNILHRIKHIDKETYRSWRIMLKKSYSAVCWGKNSSFRCLEKKF